MSCLIKRTVFSTKTFFIIIFIAHGITAAPQQERELYYSSTNDTNFSEDLTEEFDESLTNYDNIIYGDGCTVPQPPPNGSHFPENGEKLVPGVMVEPLTQLHYACDAGYSVTETISICQNGGDWSTTPICERELVEGVFMPFEETTVEIYEPVSTTPSSDTLGCVLPAAPSNGRYSLISQPGAAVPGRMVDTFSLLLYWCDEGYTNSLEKPFSECRSDGTWSSTPGCKLLITTSPAPTGSECSGTANLGCLLGGLLRNLTTPCAGGCALPAPPANGQYSVSGNKDGAQGGTAPHYTVLLYRCDRGFSSTAHFSVCQIDNSWSATPTCVRANYTPPCPMESPCDGPSLPLTKKIDTHIIPLPRMDCPPMLNPLYGWLINQIDSSSELSNMLMVNQTLEVFCKVPYTASTNSTTCLTNGQWSEIPVCYSPCEIPAPSDSMEFSCPPDEANQTICNTMSRHLHGSHIQAHCKERFFPNLEADQILTCHNGSWNNITIECEQVRRPVTTEPKSADKDGDIATTKRTQDIDGCPLPEIPYKGGYMLIIPDNITHILTERLAISSTLEYYCDDFMYEISARYSTCLENNLWSNSPICHKNCYLYPSDTLSFECTGIDSACSWTHGSSVTFSCRDGYSFRPNMDHTLQCNNGSWNHPLPECTQISNTPKSPEQTYCEFPPQPENGRYVVTLGENYNNELRFFCHENYSSPIMVSQCVNNLWTEMATCSKNCEMVTSKSVNFKCLSHLNQSILCETSLPGGTSLLSTCKMGYYSGEELHNLTCNNGSWNHPVPECEMLQMEIGEDVVIFCHHSSPGSLKMVCRNFSRSILDQPTIDIWRSWSLLNGMDRVGQDNSLGRDYNLSSGCMIPSDPENGYVTTRQVGRVPVSSVVWYVCHKDYNNASDSTMVCQNNGNWTSLPKCIEIHKSCQVPIGDTFTTDCTYQPLEKHKAIDQCKGSMPHRSYLISTCKEGYHFGITKTSVKTHICNNGRWSYPVIECDENEIKEETTTRISPIPDTIVSSGCPVPPNPQNGHVNSRQEERLPESSVVSYYCFKDYKNTSDTSMVCQRNGSWTSLPQCVEEYESCQVPFDDTSTTDCSYQPLDGYEAIGQCKASMPHGSYLISTCKRGYHRPMDVREKNHTCNNGSWSSPILGCTKTEIINDRRPLSNEVSPGCPLPAAPGNGSYTVSNYPGPIVPGEVMEPYTVLTFSCIWHSQPSILYSYCQDDNEWTELPVCIISDVEDESSRCELPKFPKNGHYVSLNNGDKLVPGGMVASLTVLTYTCNKNFDLSTESHISVCFKNNTWSISPVCYKRCDMKIATTVKHNCYTAIHNKIPCHPSLPHGSRVHSSCKPGHQHRTNLDIVTCVDGKFDNEKPICKPVCGLEKSFSIAHMVNAPEVVRDTFPWHVGIYQLDSITGAFKQICGGSIIHVRVVVTAAHCFYDEELHKPKPAKYFRVAAGKFYSAWDHDQEKNDGKVQKAEVLKILLHNKYGGFQQHYQDDVAILVLKKPLEFTNSVQAVCYDLYDEELNAYQMAPNKVGKVAGWGLTEKNEVSNELRTLNLPVVERSLCSKELHKYHYTGFLTSDKFCAGLLNGSAVCQGDSGGGLVFPERYTNRDRWYLRGVVSNGPLNDEKTSCRPNTFTAFTEIFSVRDWLRKALKPLVGY